MARWSNFSSRRSLVLHLLFCAVLTVCGIATAESPLPISGIFVFGRNERCAACMGAPGKHLNVTLHTKLRDPTSVRNLGAWWPTVVLFNDSTACACGYTITTNEKLSSCALTPLEIGGGPQAKISAISVGGTHAAFLMSNNNVVFSLGDYNDPTSGLNVSFVTGATGVDMVTGQVELGERETIRSISSGAYSDAFVTSLGNVWIWGGCAYGECGLGNKSQDMIAPRRVTFPNNQSHFIHRAVLGNYATTLVGDSYLLSAGAPHQIGRHLGSNDVGVWFEPVAHSEAMAYPLHSIINCNQCFLVLDAARKIWIYGNGTQTDAAKPYGADPQKGAVCLSNWWTFDASVDDIAATYHTAFVLTSSGTLYFWGHDIRTESQDLSKTATPMDFKGNFLTTSATISRLFQPNGGHLMFFGVTPLCSSCTLPPADNGTDPIIISDPITIIGNLTTNISTPIIITIGAGGTLPLLNVTGCVEIPGGIELNFDFESLSHGKPLHLALLEASCIHGLVPQITTKIKPKKSCQNMKLTTKVETSPSSRSTIVALISLNEAKCRIWWIVLISVIGGIVVITAAAIIIGRNIIKRRDEERYEMEN